MNRITLLIYVMFSFTFCSGQINFEQNIILDESHSILDPRTAIVVDMDNDGDLDVVSACHYNEKIVWHENLDGQGDFSFLKNISTDANGVVSLFGIDIDNDGDNDIVSAEINSGILAWYENVNGLANSIQKHIIDTNISILRDVYVADIDEDGDNDVVAISYNEIIWYENTNGFGFFESGILVSNNISYGNAVYVSDLDGDGDLDILSTSGNDGKVAWYQNLDGQGNYGTQQIIRLYNSTASDVSAADIDGDGDMDVISNSSIGDILMWHENIDGLGNFTFHHYISTTSDGAKAIFVDDIDNDGDIDIISAEQTVVYYENDNGNGNFVQSQILSDNIGQPSSVYVADIDNDGRKDILSANPNYGKLTWHHYNNIENHFNSIKMPMIDTNVLIDLLYVDIDSDGDLDIATSSYYDGELSWFENLDGIGSFSEQIIIENSQNTRCSSYADVDNDGDIDVITLSSYLGIVSFYENLDGQGNFGSEVVIDQILGANSIDVEDVDGDGDLDLIIASENYDTIHLVKNSGGQANFESPVIVSDQLYYPYGVKFVDLDGDNDKDIMAVSASYGGLFWYENTDGLGLYGPVKTIISYDGNNYNNPLCILNNANFNIVDVPIKYKPIDILNSCKSSYLS